MSLSDNDSWDITTGAAPASRKPWLITAATSALVLYAALWTGTVANWSWLAAVDDGSLQWFYGYGAGRPSWIAFWVAVSTVFSPTSMRIVALVGIVIALSRRNLRIAVFLAATVMLMGLVTAAAKGLRDRPRPGTALISETSTAFPSGHALGIMVSVLAFLTVGWPILSPRMRTTGAVVGAAVVFLVGMSRVVLNVHHTTDVLAGWALGLLYYLLCVLLVPPWRGVSAARQSRPPRYRVR